jgi:hypothetical protein
MDSETNSAAATKTASKQADTMLSEIVKNLAESLIQSGGLLELSNELDQRGVPNQLTPEMEPEAAARVLLQVVRSNNLLRSDVPLKQVMKSPPNERGLWAHETLMSNLSNEDH